MEQNQNDGKRKISVTVNKEILMLPEGITVTELLELKDARKRISVWINGVQLLLSEYDEAVLQNGDTVKLLRVVAGG